MSETLRGKGKQILANGYNLIPILPGEKRPSIKGWQKTETSTAALNGWLANGRADHGCGIPTRFTPFADLDIQDLGALAHVREHIETAWDWPPCRIGNAPKCGYVFRLKGKPFRKISSPIFTDPQGRKAQVEILADGEQFVAYAIHPDTGKPYVWVKGKGPVNIPVDELPEATEAELRRIVDVFVAYCEAQGWRRQGSAVAVLPDDRPGFYDADGGDVTPYSDAPIGLSEEELREKVAAIPNDDVAYEGPGLTWFNVMAAIHHETDGSDAGKEIALEWSEKSGKHDGEAGRFEKTWDSFNKGERRPVTARLLLKIWKEIETQRRAQEIDGLIDRMRAAKTIDELRGVATDCRNIQTDLFDRSRLIVEMQKCVKQVTGSPIGLREARELVHYNPGDRETPDWLDGWCYLKHINAFFNTRTGERIGREAFDAAYGRYVGKEIGAAKLALDVIKIPVYHMTIYLPGSETVFTDRKGEWINTYSEQSTPAMPAVIDQEMMRAIETVEDHGYTIFSAERDVRILLSVIAHAVQTGQRTAWGTIIQGAEAIGKTVFANIAAAVLGQENVYTINADTLQSNFTAWAEAKQLIFIEELRSPGHSRHDVYNRLKPFITNDTIEVHPKHISPYNVPNTATYIAATNHRDALPIGASDTRYFVILARLQSKAAVDQFKAANPGYYDNLHAAIREFPGALRRWLMGYRLHTDFNPRGRAPESEGRRRMIEEMKSDEQIAIEQVIEEGKSSLVTEDFITVHTLRELVMDNEGQLPDKLVTSVGIRHVLTAMDYTPLPRVKINGERYYCWSKNPELINGGPSHLWNYVKGRVDGGK